MALTSQLGTINSTLLGSTLTYGASTTASAEAKIVTASTSITFAPTAPVNKVLGLTGATAIAISFPLVRVARSFPVDGTTSITFAMTNHHSLLKATAASSFAFTQSASPGTIARTAGTALAIGHSAQYASEYELTAGNSFAFSHTCTSGLISRTAGDQVDFSGQAISSFITTNAIVLTASNTITFAKTDFVSQVLAAAIQLDADTTISISGRGFFPIELTAVNAAVFTTLAEYSITSAETTLTFTQLATVNREYSVTGATALVFGQSFIPEQLRNGSPLTSITKDYTPFIGSGAASNPDPPRPVPTGLTRQTDVVFYYPGTGPQASATSTVTLRTPNFGDRDRQGYNIINRESRGGTLQIFRDEQWPGQRTLVLDFSNLKESEVENVLTFLATSVGKKVGFRDWQSRTWRGVIVNPDSPIIRTRDDRIDLSIELDVDDTLLEMSASTAIAVSQTGDVVLVPV